MKRPFPPDSRPHNQESSLSYNSSADTDRAEIQSGYQSQIRVDQFRGEECVVKRVLHPGVPLLRTVEQWMLNREALALSALKDLPQVPDFLGRPDDYSIAIEFREGKTLRERDPHTLPASFFRELEETVREIHRRGFVHSDLKRKENILVSPRDRPVILDFGARFRRKSALRLLNNFCYRQFRQIDRNAVSKLKDRYCPELLHERDFEGLNNPVFFERVSRFFNSYLLPGS